MEQNNGTNRRPRAAAEQRPRLCDAHHDDDDDNNDMAMIIMMIQTGEMAGDEKALLGLFAV